jgi:ankyrin repeat protein
MGSPFSQLKKHTNLGNERKCLQIYRKYSQVRRKLNASRIIDEATLDTYMHVCAQKGMVEFLKVLLYEKNGNPNALNRSNQNVLHSCCNSSNDQRQYECMQIILQWYHRAEIKRSSFKQLDPEINVNQQDIVRAVKSSRFN